MIVEKPVFWSGYRVLQRRRQLKAKRGRPRSPQVAPTRSSENLFLPQPFEEAGMDDGYNETGSALPVFCLLERSVLSDPGVSSHRRHVPDCPPTGKSSPGCLEGYQRPFRLIDQQALPTSEFWRWGQGIRNDYPVVKTFINIFIESYSCELISWDYTKVHWHYKLPRLGIINSTSNHKRSLPSGQRDIRLFVDASLLVLGEQLISLSIWHHASCSLSQFLHRCWL